MSQPLYDDPPLPGKFRHDGSFVFYCSVWEMTLAGEENGDMRIATMRAGGSRRHGGSSPREAREGIFRQRMQIHLMTLYGNHRAPCCRGAVKWYRGSIRRGPSDSDTAEDASYLDQSLRSDDISVCSAVCKDAAWSNGAVGVDLNRNRVPGTSIRGKMVETVAQVAPPLRTSNLARGSSSYSPSGLPTALSVLVR